MKGTKARETEKICLFIKSVDGRANTGQKSDEYCQVVCGV